MNASDIAMATIAVLSLIVCRLVTCSCAVVGSQVAGRSVTLTALVPPAGMLSRVDPEVRRVVVHRVRGPDARAMATRTILREDLIYMVRICHSGIVGRMALVTVLIRKSVVAIRMTLGAGEWNVRPRERELCIRVVECCRLPSGLRVASRAVVTEASGDMVRIGSSIECPRMAIPAGAVRKPRVHIVRMALVAGNSLVSTHKRERRCRMAERRRGPDSRGVARIAGVLEIA